MSYHPAVPDADRNHPPTHTWYLLHGSLLASGSRLQLSLQPETSRNTNLLMPDTCLKISDAHLLPPGHNLNTSIRSSESSLDCPCGICSFSSAFLVLQRTTAWHLQLQLCLPGTPKDHSLGVPLTGARSLVLAGHVPHRSKTMIYPTTLFFPCPISLLTLVSHFSKWRSL